MEKVRTVCAFCLTSRRLPVWRKGGRILERRSGDPFEEGPIGKGNPAIASAVA
jgi:predicted molibdopterin-dependent oxidoreductase YjgC